MWAARYRGGLGFGLVVGGFFAGFWAAELLDGRVALPRGSIGFLAAGVAVAAGDIVMRRFGGVDSGAARYLWPSTGPSLRYFPAWAVGLLFVVFGLVIRTR